MSSKLEKERQKQIQERCQQFLTQMLKDDDNKYCVDCDAKGPRWASWNIGVFLCIRCAGIHRNLGVHISKVKSVNLDTWTPQQVVSLQQMGNSRARAVYEANLPDNFRRPQTDSTLEAFIRAKYERKKYIAREWVQPPMPKVNWDKEIEEEAERMKKKKREVKAIANHIRPLSTPSTSVTPQPLPKPQSTPSPKTSRTSASNFDLLRLDTPIKEPSNAKKTTSDSDLFANFMIAADNVTPSTATTSSLNTTATTLTRTTEEDNFFNQSTAISTSNKQKQLTKDSILALYSNPVTYTSPVSNPLQQTFPQLNGLPQHFSSPSQNGMSNQNNIQFGNMNTSRSVASQSFIANPFYSMVASQQYSQFTTNKNGSPPVAVPSVNSNAIDNNQLQMNQQMGGMNLNNQPFSQQNGQFFGKNPYVSNMQPQQNAFTAGSSNQWH